MQNLTKKEIVDTIFKENKRCLDGIILQCDVRDIVHKVINIIQDSLSSGRNVELRNFGKLEVQVRKPRVGRNPANPGDDVEIPRRAVVKFKAGKELKLSLNNLDLEKVESDKAARSRPRR